MKLRDKSLIYSACFFGLLIGKAVAGMFFGNLVFYDLTARHIIVIIAGGIAGAFLGHVIRHSKDSLADAKERKNKLNRPKK